MAYNTKQKDMIFEIIKKQRRDFTIRDIYEQIKHEVGLTTIYRFIDNLVIQGVVTKTIDEDNITYYQYFEKCTHENHFYLKCNKCKNMIHIDCDCIDELSNHVYMSHKFIINKNNIVINGICSNCNKKELEV